MKGYTHPVHRSLHVPLVFVAICGIFIGGSGMFVNPVLAVNMQSDQQCQSGGVVGQKCKDTTNGYTTSGHCTHIMVCAADSWPKAPKGCQPGQVVGRDCPYGPNPNNGPAFQPRPIQVATYTPQVEGNSGISTEEIFRTAFGTDQVSDEPAPPPTIVGSTSIEGIEYLITGDNEQLQVGQPLTPAPPPQPRIKINGGTTYSLGPVREIGPNSRTARTSQQGYRGSSSFGDPSQGVEVVNDSMAGNMSALGSRIIHDIIRTFGRLFGNSQSGDLYVVTSATPVMIVPDISLYRQTQSLSSPEILDIGWSTMLRRTDDIFASERSAGEYMSSAISHAGRAGLDLLSADFTSAGRDMAIALHETRSAIAHAAQSIGSWLFD